MFDPPKSPWMGGVMQSVVEVTKKRLKSVVKDRLLHDTLHKTQDTLHTLLLEIKSIVNSRPLTSVSDDIDDLKPLVPNHFLISQLSPNTNFTNITEKKVNSRKK